MAVTPATQSASSKAPVRANNPAGDAPVRHAYVENGELIAMQAGTFRKLGRWDAVSILLQLEGSPFPSSQERARQIRAALKDTMQ